MNFTNDEARHSKDILFKSLKQISQIAAGHWIENHSVYSDRTEGRIASKKTNLAKKPITSHMYK